MPKFQFDVAEAISVTRRQSAANRANSAKTPTIPAIPDLLTSAKTANNRKLAGFSASVADDKSKPVNGLSRLAVLANTNARIRSFVDLLDNATTLDDLWAVIEQIRHADLSLAEKNCLSQACKQMLARFYEAILNEIFIDGKTTSLDERVSIEAHQRGWFQYRQRRK